MNDHALISAYQGGDKEAFTKIYRKYYERVYWFVFKYLRNEQDTEDVVQDTFLKMILYKNSFNPDLTFSTWLFEIAKNCAFDKMEERGFMQLKEQRSDRTPEKDCIANDRMHLLEQELDRMPDTMSEAVRLRVLGQYTYKEIARALDVKIGTVKSRIHRGMEQL